MDLIVKSSGKYIVILEGDDYWISDEKLQKQADFLEKNPDFSAVYHLMKQVDQDDNPFIDNNSKIWDGDEYTIELFNQWHLPGQTATGFFRREVVVKYILEQKKSIYFAAGDRILSLILLKEGRVGRINEVMSVYRSAYHDKN